MEEEEGKDKCHWTEAERLTAVKLIHTRYAELYGKFKGATLGAKKKMAIWHTIVAKHNRYVTTRVGVDSGAAVQ